MFYDSKLFVNVFGGNNIDAGAADIRYNDIPNFYRCSYNDFTDGLHAVEYFVLWYVGFCLDGYHLDIPFIDFDNGGDDPGGMCYLFAGRLLEGGVGL